MKSKCKITNKVNKNIINFGKMPVANGFLSKEDYKKEYFYEMRVSFSEEISLLQLDNHPKPSRMFNNNYPFFTSSSNYMKHHFNLYANWIKSNFLKHGGNIIEIGSNDGTFLENFIKTNIKHAGIEPSKNVSDIAKKRGIKSYNFFFNTKNANDYLKKFKHQTDIICGANVVCHIPNLIDFIKTCDFLLNKNGKIIFEEPYLGAMYDKVSYDQIYDEHIFIFSISSVLKIFEKYNFKLVNAIPQTTHGGSMRYVLERCNQKKINKKILSLLKFEDKNDISNIDGAIKFAKNCKLSKKKLLEKIKKIKKSGRKICGYGATSKSTTILNYCNIGPNLIDCIFDTTPEKINKFSPGMHIPIIEHKFFKYSAYRDILLFAWNHQKEIMKKEKNYKNANWFSHLK